MRTEHQWQFYRLDRNPPWSPWPVIAAAVISVLLAIAWTLLSLDSTLVGDTPLWADIAFWVLIVAAPFLAGLLLKPWFSAVVNPIGYCAGFIAGTLLNDGERPFGGEMSTALVLFLWSAAMLVPWALGHVIIGALTAPRRVPKDL